MRRHEAKRLPPGAPWRTACQRFAAHRPAMHGVALLAVLMLAFAAAPLIRVTVGVDPLVRALDAGRHTLVLAGAAGAAGALAGTALALTALAVGGRAQSLIVDVACGATGLPLILLPALAVAFAGIAALPTALVAVVVPPVTAAAHAAIGNAVSNEFQTAAAAVGLMGRGYRWRHAVRNAIVPLIVGLWPTLPWVLAVESFTSLVGIGSGTLGARLHDGIVTTEWTVIVPAAVLLTATLAALHAIGDGLTAAASEDRP